MLAYGIGKPTECVDPDTLDQQEWQLYQQAPVTQEGLQTVLGVLQTDCAFPVEQHPVGQCADHNAQIGPLHRRPQIGDRGAAALAVADGVLVAADAVVA